MPSSAVARTLVAVLTTVALATGASVSAAETASQGQGDETSAVAKKRARTSRATIRRCRRLVRVHGSRRRRAARSARIWRTARLKRCRRLVRAYDAERRARKRRAAKKERAEKRACLARRGRWVRQSRRRRGRRARAARCAKPQSDTTRQGSEPNDPAPPGRSGKLRIGLNPNTQDWGPDAGQQQDLVRASGAKYIREELRWSSIEPQNDQWSFSRYDSLVTNAAQRGLTILPLLMSVPGWAGPSWDSVPSNPAEFSEYVAKVVARYGAGGDFWRAHPELGDYAPDHFEIWNEPYLGVFAAGDTDPARYARLVKAATTAGRAANPNAKFLIEADTTATDDFSTYYPWIDRMYDAVPNLGDYFDAIAVHPYSDNSPDYYTPNGNTRWQVRRLEQVRAKFAAHGDGDKHLWITEVGWTTCPTNPACATESEQAKNTARLFEMVRTDYPFVDAVFLYGYHDLNPGDGGDKEQWFGLIRRDGSFKPAWQTLKQITGAA
jgi:hypothetical protein